MGPIVLVEVLLPGDMIYANPELVSATSAGGTSGDPGGGRLASQEHRDQLALDELPALARVTVPELHPDMGEVSAPRLDLRRQLDRGAVDRRFGIEGDIVLRNCQADRPYSRHPDSLDRELGIRLAVVFVHLLDQVAGVNDEETSPRTADRRLVRQPQFAE